MNVISLVFACNIAYPQVTKDSTRFLVTRHPFARLLSCYRDKFEEARKDYYYLRYGEKMIKKFRKLNQVQDPKKVSFIEMYNNNNVGIFNELLK